MPNSKHPPDTEQIHQQNHAGNQHQQEKRQGEPEKSQLLFCRQLWGTAGSGNGDAGTDAHHGIAPGHGAQQHPHARHPLHRRRQRAKNTKDRIHSCGIVQKCRRRKHCQHQRQQCARQRKQMQQDLGTGAFRMQFSGNIENHQHRTGNAAENGQHEVTPESVRCR